MTLHVRAFDQWNNPALDDQVAVETSLGQLLRMNDAPSEVKPDQARDNVRLSNAANLNRGDAPPVNPEQGNQPQAQVIVQLENGEATLKLIGSGAPGEAKLHALVGQSEARASVRITPEMRPTIMVGMGEVTVGKAVLEVSLHGEEGNVRSRLSFFYNGRVFGNNMLTLAYDSQRPINRTAGRDRIFQTMGNLALIRGR